MRITGILQTIGDITTCEHNTDPRGPEYDFQHLKGIIITTDNDDTLRAASNLLCATVDIYPHPVDGLQPGECTPERYAHALARLAHAEDHLAREVRSSQALARSLKDAEALITAIKADLQARAASDAEEARRSELSADAKSAAWVKYLDLRRMIRLVTNEDAKTLLVNDALTLAREYDLDPTTLELEDARRTIDALHAQIALIPADIADAQRITNIIARENVGLTKENHELRAENGALRIANAAIAAKQAEQERLITTYRVQYHEADRALRKAEADIAAKTDLLERCTPPGMSIREDERGWRLTTDNDTWWYATEQEAHAVAWASYREDNTRAETNALAAQMAQDLEDERGRDEEGNALA